MSTTDLPDKTLEIRVDDIGFLLDRLGQDCAPLQFLRELTKNSIEAILRTPEGVGTVTWDVDWTTRGLLDVWKLSITDDGDGMTGPAMVRYINALSSSIAETSITGNYGVGAKISTVTRNHQGVRYLSWRGEDDAGATIVLWRDPNTGSFGLRQLHPGDEYAHWTYIEDDVKPEQIKSHGTKVILLGNAEEDNTVVAPEGAGAPSRWVAH